MKHCQSHLKVPPRTIAIRVFPGAMPKPSATTSVANIDRKALLILMVTNDTQQLAENLGVFTFFSLTSTS